jgi:hypothetical protein
VVADGASAEMSAGPAVLLCSELVEVSLVVEVSDGAGEADVEAPSTSGVDVELIKGARFSMNVPLG